MSLDPFDVEITENRFPLALISYGTGTVHIVTSEVGELNSGISLYKGLCGYKIPVSPYHSNGATPERVEEKENICSNCKSIYFNET